MLSSLSSLGPLPSLLRLTAPFNRLTSLYPLPPLPSLTHLDVRDNRIADYLPPQLSTLLPSLRELALQVRYTLYIH